MKKILLSLATVLVLFAAGGCEKKPEPGPGPEPGPDPTPTSEITTDNAAPAGFSDEGPMSWDE